MAEQPERVAKVVDLHQQARRRLLGNLVEAVLAVARLLGAGRLDRDEAADQVRGLMAAARQSSADLAWSYLDQLGTPVSGGPVLPEQDAPLDAARLVELGRDEIEAAVGEALDRAARDAVQQHGDASPDVIGYRRVPHPELAEGGTCGLCVLASTRIYRRGDLEPIHDGCNCTVAEVTATSDPGDALNGLDLGEVYDDVGSTDGREAKKVRYRRGPDGRLERYTDPKQRKPQPERSRPAERPQRRDRDQDQRRIAALEAEIRRLEEQQRAGQDVAFELDAARRRLRSLRRAAA